MSVVVKEIGKSFFTIVGFLALVVVVFWFARKPSLAVDGKNYSFFRSVELWDDIQFEDFTGDPELIVVRVILRPGREGADATWYDTLRVSEFALGEFNRFVELASKQSPYGTLTPCGIFIREDL